MRPRRLIILAVLGLGLLTPLSASAEDVVVVLSSNLRPYQETLAGLQEAIGHPVPVIRLSDNQPTIPSGTRVIVAIGGKAAMQNYPRDVAFIYCLAPGILLPHIDRQAPTAKIYMTPPASVVISKLKELQPSMKHLGILGLSESRDEFNAQMQDIGKDLGIDVTVEKVRTPSQIPDRLRSLQGRIDALWIPPDPRLITPQNFNVIKEFCLSNHIAFYVPTVELVDQGATASVAASFEDIGRAAALMAKEMMAGNARSGKVYPEVPRVAINLKSAAASGLKLSPDKLEKADKVIP